MKSKANGKPSITGPNNFIRGHTAKFVGLISEDYDLKRFGTAAITVRVSFDGGRTSQPLSGHGQGPLLGAEDSWTGYFTLANHLEGIWWFQVTETAEKHLAVGDWQEFEVGGRTHEKPVLNLMEGFTFFRGGNIPVYGTGEDGSSIAVQLSADDGKTFREIPVRMSVGFSMEDIDGPGYWSVSLDMLPTFPVDFPPGKALIRAAQLNIDDTIQYGDWVALEVISVPGSPVITSKDLHAKAGESLTVEGLAAYGEYGVEGIEKLMLKDSHDITWQLLSTVVYPDEHSKWAATVRLPADLKPGDYTLIGTTKKLGGLKPKDTNSVPVKILA